jgi:hypothetical protein
MLKSIGRSSHFWAEIVGGTVSPQPVHRKTVYQTIYRAFRRGDEASAGFAGVAMRVLH